MKSDKRNLNKRSNKSRKRVDKLSKLVDGMLNIDGGLGGMISNSSLSAWKLKTSTDHNQALSSASSGTDSSNTLPKTKTSSKVQSGLKDRTAVKLQKVNRKRKLRKRAKLEW